MRPDLILAIGVFLIAVGYPIACAYLRRRWQSIKAFELEVSTIMAPAGAEPEAAPAGPEVDAAELERLRARLAELEAGAEAALWEHRRACAAKGHGPIVARGEPGILVIEVCAACGKVLGGEGAGRRARTRTAGLSAK